MAVVMLIQPGKSPNGNEMSHLTQQGAEECMKMQQLRIQCSCRSQHGLVEMCRVNVMCDYTNTSEKPLPVVPGVALAAFMLIAESSRARSQGTARDERLARSFQPY